MQRVVNLPLDEARCIAQHCRRAGHCARGLIPPHRGRPVEDFSRPADGTTWDAETCAAFIAPADAPAAAPRVFPPLGSTWPAPSSTE